MSYRSKFTQDKEHEHYNNVQQNVITCGINTL